MFPVLLAEEENFNIPTGEKYNNKGKLKEVCMKLQNIRFVYIKKN